VVVDIAVHITEYRVAHWKNKAFGQGIRRLHEKARAPVSVGLMVNFAKPLGIRRWLVTFTPHLPTSRSAPKFVVLWEGNLATLHTRLPTQLQVDQRGPNDIPPTLNPACAQQKAVFISSPQLQTDWATHDRPASFVDQRPRVITTDSHSGTVHYNSVSVRSSVSKIVCFCPNRACRRR
jgi:hypothetical protein